MMYSWRSPRNGLQANLTAGAKGHRQTPPQGPKATGIQAKAGVKTISIFTSISMIISCYTPIPTSAHEIYRWIKCKNISFFGTKASYVTQYDAVSPAGRYKYVVMQIIETLILHAPFRVIFIC